MNYYQHHIGDFNSATRHLTRVERSLYRDLIELYYDTEKALITDKKKLARKVMARSEEEVEALNSVLSEFFINHDGSFHHDRCDDEIIKYKENSSAKARAGRASAEARKKKREEEKQHDLTGVEQVLDTSATEGQQNPTNRKPLTVNHEPETGNHLKDTPAKPTCNADDIQMAEWMLSVLLVDQPEIKKPNIQSWANTIRLMRERDGRNYQAMATIWKWARQDNFWASNILSANKFREKYDTLQAQSTRPANSTGYMTANEKAAARAASTEKMDSEADLEF